MQLACAHAEELYPNRCTGSTASYQARCKREAYASSDGVETKESHLAFMVIGQTQNHVGVVHRKWYSPDGSLNFKKASSAAAVECITCFIVLC